MSSVRRHQVSRFNLTSAASTIALRTLGLREGPIFVPGMTFEAGSTLLNVHAVTARLIDRGRHFHLVDSSQALSKVSGYPSTRPVINVTQPSNSSHQSDGVSFVLRPPTVPKEDCGSLNEAVHLEWLRGRGAGWVSGSPQLQYCKERGSFQIRVLDITSPSHDPSATIVTESGLAAALDTLEDAALDECVSRHLTEGGDDRLHLTKEGVNKYHCPPRPLPANVAIRCSCTCSPPTLDGFEAARRLLRDLWSGHTSFSCAMADIRSRISKALEVSVAHEVVLHPSGSDAELIPLAIAAARKKELGCTHIVSIVAAAGEVGSGSAPAAGGRHFSRYTPCGSLVKKGGMVTDFPDSTRIIEIKSRNEQGHIASNFDELVMNAIRAHRSEAPYFVLHAVDGSKTGIRVPSRELIERLYKDLGERLLVVLDACQCRSDPEELNWFLERGAVVLVTASKFFSAPGFCGAVLIPEGSSMRVLTETPAPTGLSDYLTDEEVPHSLKALHQSLPSSPKNIGLLLRWACGITEMEMFRTMGDSVKSAMREWVYGVRKLVRQRRPVLDLIDDDLAVCEWDETRSGGINTVVSIKIRSACGSKHIDANTLRRMHRHLTMDASELLPPNASDEEREIARLACMVGQPVNLGYFGVLRLAISATMARDIVEPISLKFAFEQDSKILDKMTVLAKYCAEMIF